MSQNETKELVIDATVENLSAVNEFVDGLLAPANCPVRTHTQLDLAVEELFVNIANYAYPSGQGSVTVQGSIATNPPSVTLAFIDEGTPYNPLSRETPNVNLPPEEREIGGLGIFLVKKNVDGIAYEYKDGKNILTIQKNLI